MEREQPRLDEHAIAIVGKYVDSLRDIENITKTTKEYNTLIDLYHENPVPLHTEKELDLFKSLETYRATNEKDLRMITKTEKKPYKVKMDYAEHIDRKWSIKNEFDEKGIELEGNFKSPIRYYMDGDITELLKGETNSALIDISNTKIREIPEQFFFSNKKLTEIRLPNTLTKIKNGAFFFCGELKKITLSNSLIIIGNSAFDRCDKLEEITIPNSVTYIGSSAFSDCTSLKKLTLSNNLRNLDSCAFQYCFSLTSISIPTTVTSMGIRVFADCTSLVIADFNPSIAIIPEQTFIWCKSLTKITISTCITKIENECFKGCIQLRKIENLENVEESDNAFEDCFYLVEPYKSIVKRIEAAVWLKNVWKQSSWTQYDWTNTVQDGTVWNGNGIWYRSFR